MKRPVEILLAVIALVGSHRATAQTGNVSGSVFVDANANGIRDAGEHGLAGVAVSDQRVIVTTDASGAFQLPSRAHGIIFVSVPDRYRAIGKFWRSVDDAPSNLSFGLAPVAGRREFSFIHASDTHIAPASVERTRRLRTLVDSLRPAFLLITGDLVRDALRVSEVEATGYYELFVRESGAFRTPVWTVPGNHENFGIERQLSKVSAQHPLYGREMYHKYLGPDYYSFTYGGVHFVGLNTVDIDDESYYGHVDSLQLAWLERDIALVPASMPVVTFDHIPFATSLLELGGYRDTPPAPTLITVGGRTTFRHTVSNAGDVLSVLRKRQHVLALGGHLHSGERIEYAIDGLRTRFHQGAAIVGPSAAAGLRFPSGITVYTVRNGEIDNGRFVRLGAQEAVAP
jgi:hypothetical protein